MQITVFGASGKIGSLVVEESLRRGYEVVAFVHKKNLFSPSGKLRIVQGDVYTSADVANALKGSNAVVSCLASWGTPKKNVLTTAMQAIIPAMAEQKISRIVTLTGTGANSPGEPLSAGNRAVMKLLRPFPAGKVFQDGIDHMNLLADSNLSWTTVRSPIMTNLGDDSYKLSEKTGGPLAIVSRSSVATAILDQLDASDWLQKAPIIHRK